jgi:very-short-patch-repair endonuclease
VAPRIEQARQLRRRETDAERHLWMRLRARQLAGAKFRRQQPLGPFVGAFCCLDRKLVVELDGSQHSAETDQARTAYLQRYGYTVLRFWDNDVLQNIEGVLERIAAALNALTPTLSQRERESEE